jgi:hypothetical protein
MMADATRRGHRASRPLGGLIPLIPYPFPHQGGRGLGTTQNGLRSPLSPGGRGAGGEGATAAQPAP